MNDDPSKLKSNQKIKRWIFDKIFGSAIGFFLLMYSVGCLIPLTYVWDWNISLFGGYFFSLAVIVFLLMEKSQTQGFNKVMMIVYILSYPPALAYLFENGLKVGLVISIIGLALTILGVYSKKFRSILDTLSNYF